MGETTVNWSGDVATSGDPIPWDDIPYHMDDEGRIIAEEGAGTVNDSYSDNYDPGYIDVTPESTPIKPDLAPDGTPVEPGAAPDGSKVTLPTINTDEEQKEIGELYSGLAAGFADTAANQEKVDYVNPTIPGNLKGKAGEDYVGDNSLVSSQLTRLIDADSDYIKQAEERAKIQSQASGLLSSSMAAGAARGAAIERALPIAQQDAETYRKHQLQQQQGDINQFQSQVEGLVSGAINEQKYSLIDRNTAMSKGFDAAILGADGQQKIIFQGVQANSEYAIQDTMARLNYYLQDDLNESTTDRARKDAVSLSVGTLTQDYMLGQENIMTNPDILAIDDGSGSFIQKVSEQGTTSYINSVVLTYAMGGVPIDQTTADLLNNLN